MKTLLLLLLCLPAAACCAQSNGHDAHSDWRDVLQRWLTAEDVEDVGQSYGEEVLSLLEECAAEPINLNQTSREELEQLPFLSAQQVEALVEYLDRYRPLRSLSELQMIKPLDPPTRQLLRCFVTIGDESPERPWLTLDKVMKYGHHTFMATAKIPFYERRGDHNGYLGYRYRNDVRYQFNYNNRIKFGLTAAQDAGEPFFSGKNKMGYDHYSYYVQLRDIGRLKELNLGMYRVQLGMGLIMNTGFHLGKLATLQSMGRATHTLTAHSSRSATGYLQGIAATIQLSRHWQATAFASLRYVDATLNDDGTVRTLINSGYHRTPTEMDKKHNTQKIDLGASIGWRNGTLYAHGNVVFTQFDRLLRPLGSTSLTPNYRRYSAEGNNFLNVSMDYGYNDHRWTLAGETALNRQGALAALHTVSLKATDQLTLLLLHRYYDKRYTALQARSFSEGSSVQNEHGFYVGASWQPSVRWLLQGYVDYAHFPWARYLVSSSSDAFDALLSARYRARQWTLTGRYRWHIRQRDNDDKTMLMNRTEHQLRMGAQWDINGQWSLRSQADGVVCQYQGNNSRGIMVSGQGQWQCRWLKAHANVGWFCTDDYDSRLYQYESSVLYDFGFPMYYGRGMRYSVMVRADLGQRLMATAKMGTTHYFDRSSIGSGLQQVDRSSLTDLLLQIRYKL